MYLRKLEILGFKSFGEKTILNFEPGITAVVGPNGCGKSNIFDSIRWVLGEQSVKSLRGSKMEDVIFNGTENIPALGYAEVSLTFSNEMKNLPIDYDEVTITRRLYRSGESEYLINKTPVRLKDITELFMGTGIGAESYSLIEQGKIDLILSSRPEDRRLVFDEASGISKYKAQKKEAARRLEDTEANLLRLNDIITEVKRQIGSLERQAAKARRYKEVFDKLKALETDLSAYKIKKFHDELDVLNNTLKGIMEADLNYKQSIELLHSQMSKKREALSEEERIYNQLKQEINDKENLVLRDSQEIIMNSERINELEVRIQTIIKQKDETAQKISDNETKLLNFKQTLDSFSADMREKKGLEDKINNEFQDITKSISSTQGNIKESKAKIMSFAAQEVSLNNQIHKITSLLNQTIARKKRLDIEKFKAQEELNLTQNSLSSAAKQLDEAFGKFSSERKALEQLQAALNEKSREKNRLQNELTDFKNELIALESQKEFLNNLKLRYEDISESSNAAVFLDSLNDQKTTGIIIKINAIEQIADTKDIPPGLSQVKFKATGTAKPISLDPQEIINRIEGLSAKITSIESQLKSYLDEITSLTQNTDLSQAALRASEIEYNKLKNSKDNIEALYVKLKEETDLVLSESKDTDIELEQLKNQEASLSGNLDSLKGDMVKNQQAIESWLEQIASKNSLRETILIDSTRLKAEISSLEEKLNSSRETYMMYEEVCAKDKSAMLSFQTEEESSALRAKELKESIIRLESEKEGANVRKTQLAKEIDSRFSALAELKDSLDGCQNKIDLENKNHDETKNEAHRVEMRTQEIQFNINSVQERMLGAYKITFDDLNQYYKPDINPETLAQEIDSLKDKAESYGQVNLIAIEEFDELKERYDFLIAQQEDLIKSKESLNEAILKINRTTKKMFMETFEKLALEFKNYFRMLFAGGDAQLFLIDEFDVLESGIEIICRPPGKKQQNVLLLSGGEKALSAIALLFAIFKVKPSPFCVLDEIDAALDESNVDRFSRMLVDFTSQSQFIMITHNKKTIATANIMYGITMEKAGVSKIVSVKLAENSRKNNPLIAHKRFTEEAAAETPEK